MVDQFADPSKDAPAGQRKAAVYAVRFVTSFRETL